ncbi:MAG: HEAT repeat domain-containing protein [Planctomycetota bacterium]
MKRLFILVALFAVAGMLASDAYAHGGSYRGPNGGVPPGQREPSDPEPPPPPPSDPGTPGGPTTPGEPGPGPTTPPDQGHSSPGDAPPPAPTAPQGPQRKATTKSLTFESWRFWWAYNNDDILSLKQHIYSAKTSSSSPLFFSSKKDEENRRSAQRPTERAIVRTIIPALMRSLNRKGDHEDIHGGALVALGKIGTSKYVPLFADAINERFKTDRGASIKFGPQATESAVLALGLLPKLDENGKEAVRRVALETCANEDLRRRDRTWGAVAIGLQKDRSDAAKRGLIELLGPKHKYADQNIPCGIVAGLGLTGDPSLMSDMISGLRDGQLFGRDIRNDDRIRAFCGFAITKIAEANESSSPEAMQAILDIMKSRGTSRIVKRSAAIACGVLGAKASPKMQDEAVKRLQWFISKGAKDPSAENFAIVALSQIGTEKAFKELLSIADSGKYGQRPFAGLALATQVFYHRRAAAAKTGDPMQKDLETKIVASLIKLSQKYKDTDTKSAFMLCRGLVKDKTAVDELVKTVSKKSTAPTLRGFCCVALGLIGDAREDVKDALKHALDDRKSTDLRRDAATGLGLLRDAEVSKLLLDKLSKAKSFAVQGQLITAIGTIGDHTAIQPLVDILDDKGQPAQTRAMAAVGLGMIGDLRDLPALSRISRNYNYRASVKDMDELLFIL